MTMQTKMTREKGLKNCIKKFPKKNIINTICY